MVSSRFDVKGKTIRLLLIVGVVMFAMLEVFGTFVVAYRIPLLSVWIVYFALPWVVIQMALPVIVGVLLRGVLICRC